MHQTASGESLAPASSEEAGARLDKFLSRRLPGLSRSRLKALIEQGQVRSGGATIRDANHRVKPGEAFCLALPEPEAAEPHPEMMALTIAYEDQDLIVIDKPAGLVVHPAAGHARGTLVNALIAHCGTSLSGIGGVKRPGIVHRLDKDTSGLMVVAKSDAVHRGLSAQFAAHGADGRLSRAYLALVWGDPSPRVGRIAAAIGRKASDRTKMAVVRGEEGRHAATRYQVLEVFKGASEAARQHGDVAAASRRDTKRHGKGRQREQPAAVAGLVRCELETGRTHQVRVHMAHIGHPLLGDKTYGAGFAASAGRLAADAQAALERLGRQALHAAELAFEHPRTGRRIELKSELPADMAQLLALLRQV